MSFRIVEISNPSELHIRNHQLLIQQKEKELVYEHLKIVDEYVTKHFKGESRRRELEDDE